MKRGAAVSCKADAPRRDGASPLAFWGFICNDKPFCNVQFYIHSNSKTGASVSGWLAPIFTFMTSAARPGRVGMGTFRPVCPGMLTPRRENGNSILNHSEHSDD